MAKNEQMLVGLDLGTTKTCVLVGLLGEQGLEVVGFGTAPSSGLRKGVVVNLDSTVESIRQAVAEAEKMCGQKIRVVQTGIAGSHLQGLNSHGIIGVKDREVSARDVDQVLDAARAVAIPLDREVIDTIPQQFFLDDQEGVTDPVGMSGVRLEVDVHIVTAAAASLQNIYRCCNRAGLDVKGVVLQQLASSRAVLTAEERELGVVLVDIGGGTTDIAVFINGAICYSSSLPLGGNQVTNDISIGLRTPLEAAEKIKRHYGCTKMRIVDQDETIEVPSVGGRPPRKLSRQILGEIIEPRMEEIFELANRELHKSGVYDQVVSGVVVTGGSALLPGTAELAEKVFELPARVGFPYGQGRGFEAVKNPMYATAVGLLQYAVEESRAPRRQGNLRHLEMGGFLARVLAWLKDFF
ncbi:MAG: cell division protein FtsA [Deltaproteobacteria bacterium]|nr:cell division protein FtsA [Deltaproteobacteria bacterium]